MVLATRVVTQVPRIGMSEPDSDSDLTYDVNYLQKYHRLEPGQEETIKQITL